MPRAINSVIARIAVFYCGSVLLLAMLLPYTTYKHGESPFVTFFSHIGFSGAGSVMNMVVLTAAFSSLNAGLYSTGRILRSMSVNGSGPKFTARMSKNGVPYGGILLTATIGLFGVVLNAVKPSQAFEIVLNIAAVGVLAAWATIVLCQLRYLPPGEGRNDAAARLPDAAGSLQRLRDAGVPGGRAGADGARPREGALGDRGAGGRRSRPDRRLVPGS